MRAGESNDGKGYKRLREIAKLATTYIINTGVFTIFLVESPSKEYNDVSDTWRL
jgi:hypothetical protein